MKDYSLYLFDLDGTLLDSRDIIAVSINAAIEHCGKPRVANEAIYPYVGLPFADYFDAFIGKERPDDTELFQVYRDYFDNHIEMLQLFSGTVALLDRLRGQGKKIASLTSRTIDNVHKILHLLNVHDHFDYLWGVGIDDFHKPDPRTVDTVLTFFDIPKAESVLVGDSITDVQTATNAKIDFVGVSFGTLGRKGMEQAGVDVIIDSLEELV